MLVDIIIHIDIFGDELSTRLCFEFRNVIIHSTMLGDEIIHSGMLGDGIIYPTMLGDVIIHITILGDELST